MEQDKIIHYVNKLIGDGLYSFDEIIMDGDSIIDEINLYCEKNYPLFSDLLDDEDYVDIPDKYIRNVICYGIAARLLEQEDEYESQQRSYQSHSTTWLYRMAQDLHAYVELDPSDEKDKLDDPNLVRYYTNAFGVLIGVYLKEDGVTTYERAIDL